MASDINSLQNNVCTIVIFNIFSETIKKIHIAGHRFNSLRRAKLLITVEKLNGFIPYTLYRTTRHSEIKYLQIYF